MVLKFDHHPILLLLGILIANSDSILTEVHCAPYKLLSTAEDFIHKGLNTTATYEELCDGFNNLLKVIPFKELVQLVKEATTWHQRWVKGISVCPLEEEG